MFADADSTTPPTPQVERRLPPSCASAPSEELSPISVREMHWRIAIKAGGGIWRGLFKSIRGKDGSVLSEPIALFASPTTGTCLGLPVSQLAERTVRKQIADSD